MPYVIQRDDGAFVRPPGRPTSYTKYLQGARTFATREDAEQERCPENEDVVHTDRCLRRPE